MVTPETPSLNRWPRRFWLTIMALSVLVFVGGCGREEQPEQEQVKRSDVDSHVQAEIDRLVQADPHFTRSIYGSSLVLTQTMLRQEEAEPQAMASYLKRKLPVLAGSGTAGETWADVLDMLRYLETKAH